MFKHVALLLALTSVSAVVGCATETGPEEQTSDNSGALATGPEVDPDPKNPCSDFWYNACQACKASGGTCNLLKSQGGACRVECLPKEAHSP